MELLVNNKKYNFESNITIDVLLKNVYYNNPKGIAVAINNKVVPKSEWGKHVLQDRDKVLIIRAVQGG